MRHFLLIVPVVLLMTCAVSNLASAGERAVAEGYEPLWPVMVDPHAPPEVRAVVNDFAKSIGWPEAAVMDHNPVCATWFELEQWKPNPSEDGFLIIVQGGGAIVKASNVEQMKLAVAAMKKLAVKDDHGYFLPVGVITNYPVHAVLQPATQPAQKQQ